jgi:hypothetical protein
VFLQLHEWFDVNLLSLNYDKTQYVHCTPKDTLFHESLTGYKNKFISISTNIKFLGIITENTLSWKAHIDQLIPKLCTACYAIKQVNHLCVKKILNQYTIPTSILLLSME